MNEMHPSRNSLRQPLHVCPFCSLLCDDLRFQRAPQGSQQGSQEELQPASTDCIRAQQGFAEKAIEITPRIEGQSATLEEACTRAAELLDKAGQALIAGLGTDMAGMRMALSLAERSGSILDHMHGEAIAAQTQALQKQGWIATTLTEIRNRADLLLLLGTDVQSRYPRFFERMIWNRQALARSRREPRVIYLGEHLDTRAGHSPGGGKPLYLRCRQAALGEIARALQALAAGRSLQAQKIAGISQATLQALVVELQKAHYGVLLWEPAQLDPAAQPDLSIQAFCSLIQQLNQQTRYAGFALGGSNGGTTALNLCLWQSGYPLRINYHNGAPQHDAQRYAAKNLLARKEIDTLFWISAFDGKLRPPRGATRTNLVQLARPNAEPIRGAQVYIPVSTPGIEQAGMLSRCDGIVALPLRGGLRPPRHPGVAQALKQIQDRLRRRGRKRS